MRAKETVFLLRGWARENVTVRLGVVLTVVLAEVLGLCRRVHPAGPYVWAPAMFLYAMLLLAHRGMGQESGPARGLLVAPRRARAWLGAHAVLLGGLIAGEVAGATVLRGLRPGAFAGLMAVAAGALGVSLFRALVPVHALRGVGRPLAVAAGWAAILAGLIFVVGCGLGAAWQEPTSVAGRALAPLTFAAVHRVLGWFYPFVYVRPGDLVIGTRGFGVRLAASCSGVESLGLMLVFSVAWLVWMRQEIVLRRALWMVPAMLGVMWVLNVLRLAVLIAVGSAGHAHFALTVFHSHAGWMLFDAAMVGFLLLTTRWSWLQRAAAG